MEAAGKVLDVEARVLELSYQELLAKPDQFVRLLEEFGVVIIRSVFQGDELALLQHEFEECHRPVSDSRKLEPNPVIIRARNHFSQIDHSDRLLAMSKMVYGSDIALYFHRLLVKDRHYRGDAWAHQDFPYYTGFDEKLAFFVSITENNVDNGSLWFAPRTHRFGYLGGAGNVNKELALARFNAFCPALEPGDVVASSFYIWHWSEACRNDRMRAFLQVVHQPSRDGSGWGVLLAGQWRTDLFEKDFDNQLLAATHEPGSASARAVERPERVITEVPLEEVRSVNGGSVLLENGELRCTTPALRWSYAAEAPVPIPLPNASLKIRVHATIESGTLGFGWLSEDKTKWIARRGMEQGGDEQFELTLPDACPPGTLVFDNWTPDGVPARAVIRKISLVAPAAESA